MKNYFYSILIILNSVIYSQFELRYPDIPADQINDIQFLNESTGFFINSGGSVLMTTDGGINWKIKAHFQREAFSEIKFIDDQNGFAISPHSHIGDNVSFIFTTNGGLNWNSSNIYMGDALSFLPVSLSNILKSSSYEATINKLDNFFGNWVETYRMPYFFDYDLFVPYGDIIQFHKLTSGEILALGSSWRAKNADIISDSVSFILKSIDSGSTWDTLWCNLSFTSQSFFFYNDFNGWLGTEQNRIYNTTDGGVTWELQYSGSSNDFGIKSISSADGINIFAVDGGGKVIFSSDGGQNWQTVQVGEAYDYPFKIKFLNSSKGFLSGYDSAGYDFWVTTNGGNNWNRVSKSLKGNIRKIDFANENTGIAVGGNSIYKTTDGGYNWEKIYGSPEHYFSGLDVLDLQNIWVVGYDSVFKSTDGGNLWTSIKLDNQVQYMRGITFLDSNIGIIYEVWAADSTFNYVTTDGGNTWKKYSINDNQFITSLNKMKFTDPGHLWFSNQKGVWLSRDTAKTWTLFEIDGSFLGFDFADSLFGAMALWGGQHKKMVFTTDGGLNWEIVEKPYSVQSEDVFIYYDQSYNTLVSGFDGSLIHFKQWDNFVYQIPTYTKSVLFSFASYKSGNVLHVWAAGNGMSVLHSQYFVTDVDDKDMNEEILTYNLSQNYPNPFNPTTRIKYSIPNVISTGGRNLTVILKIYDVLGREVATLVNEEKPAGVYEVEFDASFLASGVYYYQLKSGSHIETKKMIYLK